MTEYKRPTTAEQYVSLADKIRMEHDRQKARLRYVSEEPLNNLTDTPNTLHLTNQEMNLTAQALRAILAIAEFDRCDPVLFEQMFPDYMAVVYASLDKDQLSDEEVRLKFYEVLARAVTNGII